jgi:hypothetical protein
MRSSWKRFIPGNGKFAHFVSKNEIPFNLTEGLKSVDLNIFRFLEGYTGDDVTMFNVFSVSKCKVHKICG